MCENNEKYTAVAHACKYSTGMCTMYMCTISSYMHSVHVHYVKSPV